VAGRRRRWGRRDSRGYDVRHSTTMIKNMKKNSGYTLLFAMIVASIVLAIGVSLLTISRKEFDLSSSATQSSNAFYAADSGLGCAEYWANNNYEFAISPPIDQIQGYLPTTPSDITCSSTGGVPIVVCSSDEQCSDGSSNYPTNLANSTGGHTYEFTFYVPFSTDGTLTNRSCAAVTVERYYNINNNLGNIEYPYTDITSAGYNIGYNANANPKDCSSPSPKKVNRTIELTY
jgi:hypothetical protein